MRKNILILLIFFLGLFKVGNLLYKWIKDNPNIEDNKETVSPSMLLFNKLNLLDGSWIHQEDSMSTIEIKYKKWVFLQDEKSGKDDIYKYQITDSLPKYANTDLEKGTFLILTTEIDTLEYEILTYNDSIMSLRLFPRINLVQVYKKKL